MKPVRLGIAGAGGFGINVSDCVLQHGAALQPPVELTAVAEPDLTTNAQRLAYLRSRGVTTVSSLDELLSREEVEAVWLPVPTALHRSFTERALAAGKPVLCEKPAAGSIQDVDAMIAARDRAGLPVLVAFQHTFDPLVATLKRRLSEIGPIRSAAVYGCWPRGEKYFSRNSWAGRFRAADAWVVDSPIQNALAHFLHLALFLLHGPPTEIEAELYRAQPVEAFDTASLRLTVGGVPLLVLMTHSCERLVGPVLTINGEAGQIEVSYSGATVAGEALKWSDDPTATMLQSFAGAVRGQPVAPVATLEPARVHVLVVNAAVEAASIATVPADSVQAYQNEHGRFTAIARIEEVFATCARRGQMLHESGLFRFTRPAARKHLRDYRHFAGPTVEGAL